MPEHLVTRKKLSELGLKPGPVRARVQYRAHGKNKDYALYDRAEGVPKKTPSPAQHAALEKAQLVLRTCKECGTIKEKRRLLDHNNWCSNHTKP